MILLQIEFRQTVAILHCLVSLSRPIEYEIIERLTFLYDLIVKRALTNLVRLS